MTLKGIYTGGVVQLLEKTDGLTEGAEVQVVLEKNATAPSERKNPWFPQPFLKTKGYRFDREEANER